MKKLDGVKIGFAVTGSFCTFEKAKEAAKLLKAEGAIITPVFSFNAATMNTRFGNCKTHIEDFEKICGNPPILSIEYAEPIGPQKLFDILIIAPCTSNTAAKIALGITDTPVTMAAKSHVRNDRPVLVAMSTNDALSASAKNIGMLLANRNYYFVPLSQDDTEKKPRSCVADFSKLTDAAIFALEGKQIQPIIFS
ncbi:MAG: dipicolinate synthase subunit B [Ruminococcus sp.]|nr:dipicolinate synthase subunit B [Ruminococcus sp.]